MAAEKIRTLNDLYRMKGIGVGKTMVTRSIADLGVDFQLAVLRKVMSFTEFTNDNDPHGEHDFRSFEHEGRKIIFKIDYYDRKLEYGSEDPADPLQTCRVLTVMLAEDY